MTDLLHKAIERLQDLPADEQDRHAARILKQLENAEALREDIRRGERDIERGDVLPFDAEHIIRRGEERLSARNDG